MMSTPAISGPGPLEGRPGVYVAWGRWLDVEYGPGQLHKVGHTGNLGARLDDSAYVTCFPPGHWRYVATFELATKEDAFLLETAVLHCCRHRRLGGSSGGARGPLSELVRMTAAEIVSVASAVACELRLAATPRDRPEYAPSARGSAAGLSKERAVTPAEPTAWAASKARVERLTVPPEVDELAEAIAGLKLSGPPGPPSSLPQTDLSDYIDDLLTLDFSAVKIPVEAKPPVEAKSPVEAKPKTPVAAASQEDMVLDEVDDAEFAGAMGAVEEEIAASPFDIHAAPAPIEARDYQRDATALCVAELRREGKAILQMACRCGKTPVAFGVLRDFFAEGPADEKPINALYLVPGLSLLRQTAQKLASYGFAEPMLLVGSDPRPVPLPGGRSLVMTTDPTVIRAFVGERGRRLVISTYQSSPQVPTDVFGLTVCDEAHRVCGGKTARPFNHFVMAPRVGARLFMTATPAYDPPGKTAITMKDRDIFGGVAYRYHLRQGIAAGYVNDFRLEIVAAPNAHATPAAEEEAMPAQLLTAMAKVDKLLVFCRNIGHATRLCAALKEAALPDGVLPFESLVAHSRMGSGGAAGALRRFATPGERAVLFNCRLFQEGVEIPALNGVFFAAPRHSPRDIIQSVCRPLNQMAGKPPSVVFLPVLHDPARPPDDPANLKRYASIIPFVDALLEEDPRLYDHLLDPAGTPYPIEILGTHTLRLADGASRAALLAAVRRAVRYGASTSARPAERLLRVENIPWSRAFAEIRRVVEECGRYPKTTDLFIVGEAKANLHNIYHNFVSQFRKYQNSEPTSLEPYQAAALEALPGWVPYGVEGPYPWGACMAFLEQWLEKHEGVPPMVNVSNGGYVGLDASAMERLSGCLTCVNQGDGRDRKGKAPGSGFTISPRKQEDLDRICLRFGIRWRKERDAAGGLVKGGPPTFIQEAYTRFKAYHKLHGVEGEYIQRWFEGYPLKHKAMERLDVQRAGTAPPRRRARRATTADSD